MNPKHKKQISRIAVIGAFLMAISCTVKITLFHLHYPVVAQWINVIMNAIVVCGCYELGKIVELSRSHRWLCATAMLGYVIYGVILLFPMTSEQNGISAVVLAFFFITMVMSILFLLDLVRKSIKDEQDKIEKLKKGLEE
ncbi:MAG: hypothetical protein KBT20_07565 [Bacteroidales bacterium]|nr:hypothetical protein [Candidatus Liminaster caballi]